MVRRTSPLRPLALVFALALALAACGDSSASAPEPDVLDPAVFSGTATTVTGDSFELAGLADQDLVLWFWAPW